MLDKHRTSPSNAAVDEIVCHTIFLNPIEGSERKYNDMTKTFSSSSAQLCLWNLGVGNFLNGSTIEMMMMIRKVHTTAHSSPELISAHSKNSLGFHWYQMIHEGET